MDISMESIDPSPPKANPDNLGHALLREQPAAGSEVNQAGSLMPPPLGPPSAIPPHLTPGLAGFSFISPSKEGEVPMEFSPAVKKFFEKGAASKDLPKPQIPIDSPFTLIKSDNKLECGTSGLNKEPEMHPADIFTKSPGSPPCEFKEMLDAIDVNESQSETSEKDFLKRQKKPNLRRSRSLDLRKKLFDVSNTPENFLKTVSKRSGSGESNEETFTKIAKRPKNLALNPIHEASPLSRLASLPDARPQLTLRCNREPNLGDSLAQDRIKEAVDVLQSPDMIGDCSREHCLPMIIGKHSDLKNISHDTMASLLRQGSQGKFDKLTIIDCRYPYEFKGGHIKGAVNLYTEEEIDSFLKQEINDKSANGQTHILVFHCEFSSQRGPGMLRHLRKLDRQHNIHQYPQLTFPEMYVLHLGYKEFFSNHPQLCVPSAYIPMADESYVDDLKHFRAKAKSWTAGERMRGSKR